MSSDLCVSALDTYNSWMETVHLMKARAIAAHLVESIRYLRAGKTRERASVDGGAARTTPALEGCAWGDYVYWQGQDCETLKRIPRGAAG